VIIALSVCAAGCAGIVVLALLARSRPADPAADAPMPLRPDPPRGREEDRVRPAVSEAGEKIWIDENDVVWHEIVAWSGPTATDVTYTALGA
jgi:hypothetical protein